MTVATTTIIAGPYVGNGTTDTYAYTWKVWDKSELKVYETTDLGVQTLLTVDVDYTVNGVGSDVGKTVTRLAGNLPTDYEWYIRSNYTPTQDTDFQSQGAFFPELHEDAFDRLTRLVQQLADVGARSIRISEAYSDAISTELPTPVAGYLVGWNDTADALASLAPTDTLVVVQATAPDPNVFKLWYDTSTTTFKFWDGAVWQPTSGTDITGKQDRDLAAVAGNMAIFDADGDTVDAGFAPSILATDAEVAAAIAAIPPDPVTRVHAVDTTTRSISGATKAEISLGTLSIPTAGLIKLEGFAGAVTAGGAGCSVTWGLRVNGVDYDFGEFLDAGVSEVLRDVVNASTTNTWKGSLRASNITDSMDAMAIDIAASGMATGSQAVTFYVRDQAAGAGSNLIGATTPTHVYLSIYDAS